MLDILIIGKDSKYGLTKDSLLLEEAIRNAGLPHIIDHADHKSRPLMERLTRTRRARIAIHIERVYPAWYSAADIHYLLPNQERFPHRHLGRLRHIDLVLCKSRHAVDIFSAHGARTFHLGFTSEDRASPATPKDYGAFVHIAGASTLKGTEAVLAAWQTHPDWPELTLVMNARLAPPSVPDNVRLISEYLDDDDMRTLQNTCGIHLCPSQAEGWGHYIVEAMSTGALVITTDAPPMNELVNADTGLLVEAASSTPRHLGTCFQVDQAALEAAIIKAMTMSTEDKVRIGARAREGFDAIRSGFAGRLTELLGSDGR
ncbi:glycosyltransferase [Hoeflea sp.]|uniref:glycosyltransferase n=1 Tax=Hoeflea sp. TaxID=1940281 RepID=UPI003A92F534